MLVGEVREYDKDILSLAKSSPLSNSMKSYYVIVVKDKDGKIIDYREGGLRSLTQYFLWVVANLVGMYNYNASVAGLPALTSGGCVYNTSNGKTYIVFGSGTQTFTPSVNTLAAPIPNVSANVSMNYNITSSNVVQLIFFGEYVNSGNPFNVSEFALQLTTYYCNASSPSSYLLTYDTLSSPVSVPSGGSISVAIVINLTG